MKTIPALLRILFLISLVLSAGCSPELPAQVSGEVERLFPSIVDPTRTLTPFQPVQPTATLTPAPTATPRPIRELIVWLEPGLPSAMEENLRLPEGTKLAEAPEKSNLVIGPLRGGQAMQVTWVYALVTPFPTLMNDVPMEEIQRAWRGEPGEIFTSRLMMVDSTRAAFEARWGPTNGERLDILPESDLLEAAWQNRPAWAIIPFEKIEPRWKVLQIDGLTPLDKELNLEEYPLTVWFGLAANQDTLLRLETRLNNGSEEEATPTPEPFAPALTIFPPVNRDPGKMTTLIMTGVTALARATGHKMDTLGTTYPGRDIAGLLRSADITHISNEVSFNPDCPKANPYDTSTMFCSRPEYIELLEYIGTDVIELSGNHNNDWGRAANTFSLEAYRKRELPYFAGGENIEEAQQPALFERNGNHIALIGCNPFGPTGAWATADQPGAAPCSSDIDWLLDAIRDLRDEGYLPVVTFQFAESYTFNPSNKQMETFRAAVEAGAVIVSGSQAHYPQIMEFYEDGFIHYGLGNLFFDQMDIPVPGTRREFIDRHTFYDGRYIQTELFTALLEDYARPRPMSAAEHENFLTEIFDAAGW